MGVGQRKLAPLWTLALALACTQHTGHAQDGSSESSYGHHPALSPIARGPSGVPLHGVTLFPPLRTIPVVRASNPAHNGRVCSTWGNFHYKTFDGDVFRFPGLCNYVFSEHCGAAYEDFNVQLRRSQESAAPTLSRVLMKVDGVVIQLTKGSVLVNGRPVLLPFSQAGVFIQQSSSYTKVEARLGLVLMWNHDDSLLLELDAKYANKTCGLCGDFNGMPVVSELLSHNIKLTPMEFGNLQKMDDPTEQCEDPVPEPPRNCSTGFGICEELLNGQLFSSCVALVDVSSYLEACRQDLCFCGGTDLLSCVCHTLAEYSRQCAHAGGLPQDWRGPDLCPQTCPSNMQYHECRSPCTDTCSNQEHSRACEDHCVAGCFCPEGTVLDDVGQTGCVPASQCACVYNGAAYASGATYSTDCTNCTCSGGRWSCQEVPCPGTCSVLGGAHFSTFDERHYTVHGDCSYVLTKPCDSSAFTVLAELRRCGLTDSETCLKSVTLSLDGAQTVVVIKASGEVFLNQIYTQLPISAANVTIFRPSTFFIIAQTSLGLQLDLQLVPTMQLFVRLAPKLRGQTCGLCGNFNSIQADDFRTLSGVVEATAAAFFNTFKTQAACPNIRNSFEDPCSLSVENEKYAQHWCSQLTDANGPFSRCHAAVKPDTYYSNCMFDTCNCERSEDCLCAVLSSYVHVCAAKGVQLSGWRNGVCTKPMTTCPKSMTYHYHVSTCQPTCRSLSEGDITCSVGFIPVDGCICPEGTFLDDTGKCVQASNCPCYHRGSVIPNGESVHDSGAVCTCMHGKLSCIGGQAPTPVCASPMVFFDCRNATPGDTGAGCQKSCHTLDMTCYSPQCVPGCVCPDGLVADGEGGCIQVEDCPCVHNEASYRAGQTIRVGCNTCTCDSRMWRCTDNPCLATCAVYGDGHYLTFDGQSYSFNGDCEYMLVQNHCGGKGSAQDSFRVVTENIPCGTTGTTCSKAIKIFLGGSELKLSHGKVEVIGTDESQEVPYTIRQMGIYLVVDTDIGLVLLWDKKTSIFINLSPEFKSRVCGLCGNFDDIAVNDFATRSQSVVGDELEFGNSWKLSPSCPDALAAKDPCTANPFRKSWAQKQCSILHGPTFAACHAHVEPARYYEACVNDACACDSGGDCECFCTAVAAYAQACHEVGLCVSWRTPSICPLFCDYYNPEGQCEWHYQPCGAPCLRTCRNPRGDCLQDIRGLEGCYPKCPTEAPIFDEDKMQCVATCPTPPLPLPCHVHGKSYRPGAVVPSDKNCHSCLCTERGVKCSYEAEACVCTYDGQRFHPGDVIYHTTDGTGGCISARCGANGTIERRVYPCSPTTPVPATTFSFSTPPLAPHAQLPYLLPTVVSSTHTPSPVPSSAHTGPPSSAWPTTAGTSPRTRPPTASALLPPVCGEECLWSPWMDISRPGRGMDSGDFDTLENLRTHGYLVCESPRSVECRAEDAPRVPLRALGQHVQCSLDMGLTCRNREQASGLCYNYQIRVMCCTPLACSTSSTLQCRQHQHHPLSTTAPGTSVVSSKPTHTESTTPSCVHELCTWTEWIDGSYPDPGINGGDFDTFQNLRDEGYKFCENPQSVECRAQGFPNTPLADLGQDVICSRTEGLICLNKNQLPPICYNYEIRIQCCKTVNKCRDGTRTLKTVTTTRPTPHPAGAQTQTTFTTHMPSASTEQPTATSRGESTATSITQGTHSRSVTRDCHPQCTWTKWFDVDFPSPGPHGGDEETYNNIIRSGEKICRQPEEITGLQCRAKSHPEVSIKHLGQVVQCSREEGLVCRNQDQQGPFKMCFNYEVRVLCCETPKGCPVTSTPVTAPSTPSGRATSPTQSTSSWQKPRTTTLVTISTTSTPQTSTISTPTTSMTSAPTPRTTYAPTTSTTSAPTTNTSSAPTTSTTSAPTKSTTCTRKTSTTSAPTTSTTSAPTTSMTSAPTTSTTSAPTTSTNSAPTTSTSSAPTTSTTSIPGTTPSPVPTTSTTSAPTTSTTSAATTQPLVLELLPVQFLPPAQPLLLQLAPHNRCFYNQNNLWSWNYSQPSSYHQHNLCSYNQHQLCSYNQHQFCSYNQHNLYSWNYSQPCSHHQHNLCSYKQHNLCCYNQHNLCFYNQHNVWSGNYSQPCSYHQYNLCSYNQHHQLCSYNQYQFCSYNQHNFYTTSSAPTTSTSSAPTTSRSSSPGTTPSHHNLCSYNQHQLCSYNQHQFCSYNQHNLWSWNYSQPSSYHQHNLCSNNQNNLCPYKQHNLCRYNQHNLCFYNQHNLYTTFTPTTSTTSSAPTTSTSSAPTTSTTSSPGTTPSPHNLCFYNQHNLWSWNDSQPCSYHQYNLCSYNQHHQLCSYNQYQFCSYNQHNLYSWNYSQPCSYHQHNLCFYNQHNLWSWNYSQPRSYHPHHQLCSYNQHHQLCSYNQYQFCSYNQHNLYISSAPTISTTSSAPTTSTTSSPGTTPSPNQHQLSSYNQHQFCSYNQHQFCSYNQHNLYSWKYSQPCSHHQHNLCSYNQSNLCPYKHHNICHYNQHNLCSYHQHNLCSYNQHQLCSYDQHNLQSWNFSQPCSHHQHNLCSHHQHNLCFYNQHNLCTVSAPTTRKTSAPTSSTTSAAHKLCSYNQHNLCLYNQHNLWSWNDSQPCSHHQHDLCSYYQHNLCYYNQPNLCPYKQYNLHSTDQHNLCSYNQHNFWSWNSYHQHNLCFYNQHQLCSYDQHNLQSWNYSQPCSHHQHNFCSYNQQNLCFNNQHNLCCWNYSQPCSYHQHNLSSYHQPQLCSDKQHNLWSWNYSQPCSHYQHNFCSYNQNNLCTYKQHNLCFYYHTTSAPTSSTTSAPTTSTTSAPTTSTTSAPTTSTPCFCNVTDRLYPAGSTIYHHRDLAGHCYYALCSQDCQVVRGVDSDCPSTTLPPAPATSPWTSTSEPVTELGCPNVVPPRKKGETWAMPNCSEATCEGNNIISLHPRTCPRVEKPTCANGYPALKVADQDGCCHHYQCQCVCSGWGDPHYITFDGTYYTFLDNCTYVLVQQIVPVYGHFRVLVDNDFCGAEDGLSCPRSIILEYQQDRVVLTRKPVHGVMTNEIIFNDKVVSPGFRKNGIVVSRVGIKMYATVPALGVQVMFSGLIFSVEVPFSKFANNTEGQCGTCTNDLEDECRTPEGTVVASCSEMSGLWNVSIPNQPACHGPRPLPTTVGPTTVGSTTFGPTTPPALCPPSSICQLILSKVFEPCHAVIPPLPFYEGCTFDQCHKTDPDTVCSSLELYAALCASQDICIDWRGRTNHTCPFTCPADKVYQPCGPSNASYCYGNDSASLGALPEAGPITEGCFCPEGMTLFSTSAQVCVPTGCPICNTSRCPAPVDCPEGARAIPTYEEGTCCPVQNCNWTECSINGTLYQPGAVVSSSLCETCKCELPGGSLLDTFVVSCETQICNTHCPVGFEYQEQSGQCCGTCVQVACVANTSGSSIHLFYPGETWSDPGNHCVTHECEKHLDGLVVVTTKKACPPLSCSLDEAHKSEDGCCHFCPPPPLPPQYQNQSTCAVYHRSQIIQQQGCNSSEPVRLAYCRGNCGDSYSMYVPGQYSFEGNMVEHRCQCCQELRTSLRNVTLHCADGSSRAFSFTEVEQCGCMGRRCPAPGDTQHSEEMGPKQNQEAGSGSWERGTPVSPVH
ncbi:LOW QUALITY PROTEIN: mucin-5AC [Rhinopithecus roxellana]|uniref:LOW QUALITY PROTEIN: mucin-5AC n=1 Tax=Rhinopithecus roxellana TaxID=61622 RepID=UPI001237427A|nr:LOW QUALITY PROTEIN: mucin-5AC [Rhinopithecus roxellana]